MIIDDDHLSAAFIETDAVTIRQLGLLTVSSGRIVACDPLVFPETEPFSIVFPIGTFPVFVSVAHEEGDERVAFAWVQFADELPRAWEQVAQSGADFAKLEYDEYFGYAVDTGIGCFMDADGAQALGARMKADEMYYEEVLEEMEKSGVDTWQWADISFEGASNMICF